MMKTTGNFHIMAILKVSCSAPCRTAPSPMDTIENNMKKSEDKVVQSSEKKAAVANQYQTVFNQIMEQIKEQSLAELQRERTKSSKLSFFGYDVEAESNFYETYEQIEDETIKLSYLNFIITNKVMEK